MRRKTILLIATIFIVVFTISFLGGGYFFVKCADAFGERKVKLIKDIDLVKDHAFYGAKMSPPFKFMVKGIIKKDSIGTQTMKKGNVIYLNFSMIIPEKYIEYVE